MVQSLLAGHTSSVVGAGLYSGGTMSWWSESRRLYRQTPHFLHPRGGSRGFLVFLLLLKVRLHLEGLGWPSFKYQVSKIAPKCIPVL
jgi:hypothetical protein